MLKSGSLPRKSNCAVSKQQEKKKGKETDEEQEWVAQGLAWLCGGSVGAVLLETAAVAILRMVSTVKKVFRHPKGEC